MKKIQWFVITLLVIALDQLSKNIALHSLLPYDSVPLLPFLSLTLAYNTGAAFSFLSTSSGWQIWAFGLISLTISIGIIIWMLRLKADQKLYLFALSLILGGALGNVIDRIRFGYVIDFIYVSYRAFHWPVFNIADSAICIGALLLLLDLWKNPHT